jgi:hypothetical protein
MGDARWTPEKDERSTAMVTSTSNEAVLQFALAAGQPRGQYAALASSVGESAGIDRISFVGRADQPRRISVQFRLAGRQPQRWRHSVYLDATARPITVHISDFEPADDTTSARPNVVPIGSILFVVDTVNTRPGVAGQIAIADVRLGVDRLGQGSDVRSGP